MTRPMTWRIVLARTRIPLLLAGLAVLIFGGALGIPVWARLALVAVSYVVAAKAGTLRCQPTAVALPVAGRWMALNSPADRVPSHGVQAYGQTYALDLLREPDDGSRPSFGWLPLARRPGEFPAFGEPIFAAADGVVVRVSGRQRDHWSRNSWPALLYVLVEGMVRELTGPGRVLGNHVIVDLGGGAYAAYAHLRRGSLQVKKGDRVRAGQHIADCGNSGNTTEPHLHFHLMDHPRVLLAAGLPVSFDSFEVDGQPRSGVPAANLAFVVEPGGG